jgi:hypothetical protein
VARLLDGVATDFVIDRVDAKYASSIAALDLRVHVTDTVMTDDDARARLAAECLAFASPRSTASP